MRPNLQDADAVVSLAWCPADEELLVAGLASGFLVLWATLKQSELRHSGGLQVGGSANLGAANGMFYELIIWILEELRVANMLAFMLEVPRSPWEGGTACGANQGSVGADGATACFYAWLSHAHAEDQLE